MAMVIFEGDEASLAWLLRELERRYLREFDECFVREDEPETLRAIGAILGEESIEIPLVDTRRRMCCTADSLYAEVYRTDEGLVADIYDENRENCITSTYAFFTEGRAQEE